MNTKLNVQSFFEKLNTLSSHEKGVFFERFLKNYFQNSKQYKNIFNAVYLWNEYPDRKGRDTGVDIVAFDYENNKWGIQAKYHSDNIVLKDISTFLSLIATKEFYAGILVVKSGVSKEVENRINNFDKKIILITIDDILQDVIDIDIKTGSINFEDKKKSIRPYQKEAIDNVINGFKNIDRGKLIMPPGSGKTFTALKITETMFPNGGLILFVCPSISLLDQSLRCWLKDTDMIIKPLAVVSDTTVGKDEDSLENLSILSYPPTTNTDDLLQSYRQIKNSKDKSLNVIFSTYQSLEVIREAQRKGLDVFDLIICDEAHKTAGYYDTADKNISVFKMIHSNEFINGRKRLYMTATPKIYKTEIEDENAEFTVYSMDDEKIYGPTFYEYTFRRAVDEGYLSDYKVIVYGMDKSEVHSKTYTFQQTGNLTLEDTTKLYGLLKFIANGYEEMDGQVKHVDIKKGILFVNTIKDSKKIEHNFKDLLNVIHNSTDVEDQKIKNLTVNIKHIDGQTPAIDRKLLLNWLDTNDSNESRFLVNAKVLTEGIDVPSLDLIAFFRPKRSIIDIIQAIGRVMRKAPGKTYGYIIIPITIDKTKSEDEQIDKSDYKMIVEILDALRSIDVTYNAEMRVEFKQIQEQSANKIKTEQTKQQTESKTVLQIPLEIKSNLTARILKRFGLGKKYLETWATDVSKIAKILKEQISNSIKQDSKIKTKIDNFINTLRKVINENITLDQAVSMLVQYMLTKPIFDVMFDKHEDIVSQSLNSVVDEFKTFFEKETEKLSDFYRNIENRAKGIYDDAEKQDFLRTLYDNFFRIAFASTAEQLGIAYTPVQLVDFTIRISDDILQKEFNQKEGINSDNVVILEPFAGTGTFLSRIVSYLNDNALIDKYDNKKLWANEILLLPYYISKVNIETTYKQRTGNYKPFDTMLLVDSFQMMEKIYEEGTYQIPSSLFPEEYSELLNEQKNTKINLIVSNPPYFAFTESENTDIVKAQYPKLRERIRMTFAEKTETTNKNSLYDSYIMAIRMGLDRIKDGVVAYVINNGWLDSNAGQGVRRVLEQELDKIYIVNLKGNLRKNDKFEGENVFNVRVGICIVFMVKKQDKQKDKKAEIYYYDIGDNLKAKDKLKKLIEFKSLDDIPFRQIIPNDKGDWINQRGEEFYKYPVLGDNKGNTKEVLFNLYSAGLKTNRDSYMFNFSKQKVKQYVTRLIDNFNKHVDMYIKGELTDKDIELKQKIELDERKIKWDSMLLKEIKKKKTYNYKNAGKIYECLYRPFVKQKIYFSNVFNSAVYQTPKIFPYPEAENVVILVTYKTNVFDVFVVNSIYSVDTIFHATGFPLYQYITQSQQQLFTDKTQNYKKVYNISDYALSEYRKRYGEHVTEEDIFYYIFGMLNNPNYQEKFKNELIKDLPRIPFVDSKEEFIDIMAIGKTIAQLLLNYEKLPFYNDLKITIKKPDYTINKMKLDKQKGVLVYNDYITIENIPQQAFEYKVNGKSPIEWIVDRYKYVYDEDTDTINDPNDRLKEKGETYVLDLIKRLVFLSLKIIELKQKLIELKI